MAGAHSFAQYLSAIDNRGLGEAAREQAFRRIVFNVASMNRDDHTKNVAFLLPENGGWQLAPAYDITPAHNPSGQWTSSHQMSVEGKPDTIQVEDLYQFADKCRVPGYRTVITEVLDAVRRWQEFAGQAGVDAETTARIADDLASIHIE